MPMTKEEKDHYTLIAKAAANTIIQKRATPDIVTDKSAQRSMAFSVPNIITKRAENDGSFRFVRLFKSLLKGTDSNEMQLVEKAMSTGDDSLGGVLVPPTQSAEIIDFLGARAAIRMLGSDIMPMTTGTLPIPKVTGGVQTYYIGENVEGTVDNVDTGEVILNARSIVAYIPMSNQLLQDSASAERTIRNTLTRSLAIAETESFIQGTGGVKPLGLLRLPNKVTQTSVSQATLVLDDIQDMITAVHNAESLVSGILLTPTLMGICRKIKDDHGRPILQNAFSPQGLPTLLDIPYSLTTKCTLGTTHYMIAADFEQEVVIGQRSSLEFAVSEHVEFKKNQTVIRAIMRHDIVARHEEAIVVLPVTAT